MGFKIKRLGNGYLATVAGFFLAILSVFMLFPVTGEKEFASATDGAFVPSTTELTITSQNATSSINVTPIDNGGAFVSGGKIDFSVSSNNYGGFGAALYDMIDGGKLVNTEDSSLYLESIDDHYTEEAFPTNKWGIKPSKYVDLANPTTTVDNTGDDAAFIPFIVTHDDSTNTNVAMLMLNFAENAGTEDFSIELGAKVDSTIPSGTYEATYVIHAAGTIYEVPIHYYPNAEGVTNMPEDHHSSLSEVNVELSNVVPEREHYSFIGWCSTEPTNTNGTDSCSGNVFNPNGDGTNLTYSFDYTAPIERPNFYAMWQIETFTCTKQYRLQNADGTWGNYIADGTETINYGGSCAYAKTVANYKNSTNGTNGAQASTTATNVTEDVTVSLDFYRNTYTCSKQYRLQNADGTWGNYVQDTAEAILHGASCSYSKTVTDYKNAANGTNGAAAYASASNVTTAQTLSLDFYRNTYALTVTAGSNTSTSTGAGTYRWGDTAIIGVTKANNVTCTSYAAPTLAQDTATGTIGTATNSGNVYTNTYTMPKSNATVTAASAASNVAQTITFKTSNATSITLNGTAKTNNQTMSINCGTYNLSGAIPANYHFTSWGATAGTLGSASTLSTTYQVTGNDTITLNAAIDSYNQTTRYRYENADGTWGSWTTAETVSKNYGSSYSWSTSQISNFNSTAYQAASVASYTVTGAKTNDVNIYRKTFTCFIQSRDQGTDGSYGSYTTRVNSTVRYGGTCSWSANATTSHQAASYSNTNVTANVSQSLDVNRKTFTCSRQYRLQNADGTWGNYTADGSATAYYGGSCAYAKTVTDYKNSASGTNGAQASTAATNVTSDQTLSLSFYRNTYTLTVSAGTNTSSATGGGTKRWGEAVTVGVTKAADVTCTTYGAPTWTQSGTAGIFSATSGASVTFTMGKGNATVTATSAASNVAQTITLSRTGGAASIVIAGTGYTGTSVSLNCGTYNISGTYSSNYEFSSWDRANGVAVANTAAASTTMTVSGAGTLTLNGKSSKIYMQDVTTANCPTTRTLAYDKRDEKTYYIQKITYNNTTVCWMTSDLDLAGGTALYSDDSNVEDGYSRSGGRAYYTLPQSGGRYGPSGFSSGSRYSVYNSESTDCNASYGCYSYYTFDVATAGYRCSNSDTACYDICPKGWQLPANYYYANIVPQYGGGNVIASPWYATAAGVIQNSSFFPGGGHYWTNTAYTDGIQAYAMHFGSDGAAYSDRAPRYYGYHVRCMAK